MVKYLVAHVQTCNTYLSTVYFIHRQRTRFSPGNHVLQRVIPLLLLASMQMALRLVNREGVKHETRETLGTLVAGYYYVVLLPRDPGRKARVDHVRNGTTWELNVY